MEENQTGKKDKEEARGPIDLVNPFRNIQVWVVFLLLAVSLSLILFGFRSKPAPEQAPPQQQQEKPVSRSATPMRGGGSAPDSFKAVAPEKVAACDFSEWEGKTLNMFALQQTGRDYTFYPKGTEEFLSGDPQVINIELDGYTVINVWCG